MAAQLLSKVLLMNLTRKILEIHLMQHKPDHPSHIYWFYQKTLMDLWNMTSLYKNNVVSSPGYLSGCLSSLFITVFYHFIEEKSQSCWSALSQVSPTLLKRKKKSLLWLSMSYFPFLATSPEFISVLWKPLVQNFGCFGRAMLQFLDAGEGITAFPSLSQQFMTSLAQT